MSKKLLLTFLGAGLVETLRGLAETGSTNSIPGGDDAAALAKKLSNPVAALISVPFQNNFDFGGGPAGHGFQYKLNVQPVVPFGLNEDWNLISRTIVPVVHQSDIIGTSSQTGLSDTVQSVFFSPKAPTSGGWIWGAGPVFLLPTATESVLGTEKWGAGPTGVLLNQQGGWTYGVLANHLWDFAGKSTRTGVNATFIQPFLSYTTPGQTTLSLNTESTYDWNHHQWSLPFNAVVSQLVKIGNAPVQFALGARYYADGPAQGPDWGLRFTVTFLLPK